MHKNIDHSEIERLRKLAKLMDSQFNLPGTNIRFGLDSILGIIPGVGDTVTLLSTIYLVGVARTLGVPFFIIVKMIWNALIDWFIGLIPLIGDIFDVGWKSNQKNVALIIDHLEKQDITIV